MILKEIATMQPFQPSESIFDTSSGSEQEISNFRSAQTSRPKKKKSLWKDAELIIPANRIYKNLRKGKYAKFIRKEGAVYMGAVIEYLVTELLDIAATCAHQNNKKRIAPRNLMMAIRMDEEYDRLLKNVIIPHSGVLSHIESVLLPLSPNNSRKRQSTKPGKTGAVKRRKLTDVSNDS